KGPAEHRVSASIDELLASALSRGDENLETGRYIVTYKENAGEEGMRSLSTMGLRVADARDFTEQAVRLESVGDAEAVVFPEIGAAVISGGAFNARGMSVQAEIPADSPIEAVEPEYFVFAHPIDPSSLYLRGFVRAAEAIAQDLRAPSEAEISPEEDPMVVGATWGLIKCRVPQSARSGTGIK